MMANSSACASVASITDRKSTRLNSSHTEIYTLSLHDALPIYQRQIAGRLFDRIQISALHVFDDGEFERLRVGRLDHRNRHLVQTGTLGCAPSPLAGDRKSVV